MRQNFRPEFVNRIDEYIVFEGLKREQIKQIVRIQAKRVAERLAAKKITLQLNPSAEDYLVVRQPFSGAKLQQPSCPTSGKSTLTFLHWVVSVMPPERGMHGVPFIPKTGTLPQGSLLSSNVGFQFRGRNQLHKATKT